MSKIEDSVRIPGYCIESKIYVGTRTLVYRGYRESDRLPVILKLMHKEYPKFDEIIQFRNQYTITKNLNISGIVKPLSLEPYKNGYLLVMEDIGGISLKEYTKQYPQMALPLIEFLPIAIQITTILEKVHRACIIHKDIKPANILIDQNKQIKLIDFSIASLLPKEIQTLKSPNILEGTLAYLSPEQTGRMNRSIDYRSDFYSLGVTFYELLTGQLPFNSSDAMELVHCHIAKEPTTVNEINFEIPQYLSDIVQKLMSKNAEDRYQSLHGLRYDLEHFQDKTGKIELGTKDIYDRFIIPEKLYGREKEVEILLQAFNRVINPPQFLINKGELRELVLIVGFSGIGKTAVVNQVHKPILERRGYFIKGKFDQFNRNIPLSAFVQAFRDLIQQLLSESGNKFKQWKSEIQAALGDNGQVIIEVIPELEYIIGKQPPIAELSGIAAQNRFNLLFQKFLGVLTTKEHPLVIFLDDLQWADAASLNLIKLLMSQKDNGYLLLIGAYRDNEVSSAHSLIITLDEIAKIGATINTITLAPLGEVDINYLVADTLKCTAELAQPLTELVYQKTQGNPFFATQFLKVLYQNKLIKFVYPEVSEGGWQCDITKVRDAALTDNVVELMAEQLQKLPVATQNVLKLAACIGNQFNLATLAVVCELSQLETATVLWHSLQLGLILPSDEIYKFYIGEHLGQTTEHTVTYKFLHDRVQQAAYSLIDDEQKQAMHWKVGQILLQNSTEQDQGEHIFDIVNQLNMGITLVEKSEKVKLAQLNLLAGQKARTATAYHAAANYTTTGINLLNQDDWQNYYSLTLELHNLATDTAFLTGEFDKVTLLADIVKTRSQSVLDQLKVCEVQIQTYTAIKNYHRAIEIGLEFLKALGINAPTYPNDAQVLIELWKTKWLLWGKTSQDLLNRPMMTNPQSLAISKIAILLTRPSYYASTKLMVIISLIGVQLIIKQGNSPFSSAFYSLYGAILPTLGDYEGGYQFGQLSLDLLERNSAPPEVSIIVMCNVGGFTQPWKQHLCNSLPIFQSLIEIATFSGDLLNIGVGYTFEIGYLLCLGVPLGEFQSKAKNYLQAIAHLQGETNFQIASVLYQFVLNLVGQSSIPSRLIGEACNEEILIPKLKEQKDYTSLYYTYNCKLSCAYCFNDYTTALESANHLQPYSKAIGSLASQQSALFFDSLTRLAVWHTSNSQEQKLLLRQVERNQKTMHHWAKLVPMNCQHKYDLVEAERYYVLNQYTKAIEYYDRAIAGAKENGYIHEEAVANELAAKFYLNWGKEIARAYMQEAYYNYARWGALAKTKDLENRYPQLLTAILQQEKTYLNHADIITNRKTITESLSNISDVLDFTSVIKASQALSSEIKLDKLLAKLIQVVMENTGARKAALILLKNNIWVIEAYATINQTPIIMESIPFEECHDIATSPINYVKHTLETLLLDDATTSKQFLSDPYIIQVQPKSLLITPILNQGKLIGLLYLENYLSTGVFTSYRLQVINLLCSQATISLENARLYQEAQQALLNLKEAQLQLVQSEKMSALGNLVAGVAHEINNPVGFIAGNIEPAVEGVEDLFSLIDLYQQEYPHPSSNIIQKIKKIDLEYLRDDLPKLIDSMNEGVQRICDISNSLRTFSRADTDHKVSCNIHEGLDSTILILKHRLKASETRPEIEVVKDYGNLAKVNCFPGQLNQVFMNLLANAIDALEESSSKRSYSDIKANPNRITITTRIQNENQVLITIKDNGVGMSEEVKQKIFDHLYTTKGVGKGTGLGLSIVRQIVIDKHKGTIQVNSQPGQGAEFIIMIPAT
jgi:predicted ATPase/signal transduction histidine kinase/tRNA A-37 threonylcarbamoyl transferase component Bud32